MALMVSRAMTFADPYLGIGYTMTSGQVLYPIIANGVTLGTIDATGSGTPSRIDAGLDLPGAVDPTGPAMLRYLGMMMFIVGSIGSIAILVTRRPSGGGMHPA